MARALRRAGEAADPVQALIAAVTIAYFQEQLEAIYGVSAPRVEEFLVDRERARFTAGDEPTAPEVLLVRESDDGVELGLFLELELGR